MNPTILSAIMRMMLTSGAGTIEQSNPALWGSPEEQLQDLDEKTSKPIDRIKDAFMSIKDMHKGANQTAGPFLALGQNEVSPLDGERWPQGPIDAPRSTVFPIASPKSQQPSIAQMQSPMKMAMASQPAAPDAMSFFQRNAALQRDPVTGEYIDPTAAAEADPGIFKGLFS